MEEKMSISKNVGGFDRGLRIIGGAAITLAGAFLMRGHYLVTGIDLAMLAVGLIGFCPVYVLLGISTRKQS
jgi:hypothetical protein